MDLTLRNRKKNTESKIVEVMTLVEKKKSEESGYVVHASQIEKEYFDKIKRAVNIFMKDVSKGEMAAIKQLHKLDKRSNRKGRKADKFKEISKEKLVFQSGGFV